MQGKQINVAQMLAMVAMYQRSEVVLTSQSHRLR